MSKTVRLEALQVLSGTDNDVAVIPESGVSPVFMSVPDPDPLSLQFAYNKKDGQFSIIFEDGSVLSVTGFLTDSSVGTGTRGKKGPRGLDGKAGRIGSEGRTGKTGCPGLPGLKGFNGNDGADGADGPIGPPGKMGCIGPEGELGEQGEKGITGHEGSQGIQGSSCRQGEEGPVGETPYAHVFFSHTPPVDNLLVNLWAEPTIKIDPDNPDVPVIGTPMTGTVPAKQIDAVHVGGSFYQGTLNFVLTNFSGGTGPFTFKWTGDWLDLTDNSINVVDTGDTGQNLNLRCRIYQAGDVTRNYSGTIRCTVTDVGDGSKTFVAQATYTFTVRSITSDGGGNPDPGDPGGGGGCIVYGQRLSLTNGETIPVQSALFSDMILGADIRGLPDSSNNPSLFLNWSATDPDIKNVNVELVDIKHGSYRQFYLINNLLKVTLEETIYIRRNGVSKFVHVKNLRVGDELYHVSGSHHAVTEIKIVDQNVRTVSLNVEIIDTYFVEGYLFHNRDEGGPIMKH